MITISCFGLMVKLKQFFLILNECFACNILDILFFYFAFNFIDFIF